MKKAFLILLVSCLLCLCACSANPQYAPLLENLENGNYEGVKKELASLSPEFRTEQEQLAANEEKLARFAPYEELIALLEAEDYAAALNDIYSRIPVPEEPPHSAVEINAENWEQYLVLEEIPIWSEDTLSLKWTMCLKREYAQRVVPSIDSALEVDLAYDLAIQSMYLDFETQSYTPTHDYIERESTQIENTIPFQQLTERAMVIPPHLSPGTLDGLPLVGCFENIEITHISGTLYLYDE